MKKKTPVRFGPEQRFRRILSGNQSQTSGHARRSNDSIDVAQFDIAPFYFYTSRRFNRLCRRATKNWSYYVVPQQCDDADDNGFEFRVLNELYEVVRGSRQCEFQKTGKAERNGSEGSVRRLKNYRITVTELSDCDDATEFNLQFARLNLSGTVINSGEKLNAMIGALRDFGERGRHEFLESTSLPTRRFSKEQLTAQILAQVFVMAAGGEGSYTRRDTSTSKNSLRSPHSGPSTGGGS